MYVVSRRRGEFPNTAHALPAVEPAESAEQIKYDVFLDQRETAQTEEGLVKLGWVLVNTSTSS